MEGEQFFYEKLKRHSVEVTFVNQLGTRNSGLDRQRVRSIAIYGTCTSMNKD